MKKMKRTTDNHKTAPYNIVITKSADFDKIPTVNQSNARNNKITKNDAISNPNIRRMKVLRVILPLILK